MIAGRSDLGCRKIGGRSVALPSGGELGASLDALTQRPQEPVFERRQVGVAVSGHLPCEGRWRRLLRVGGRRGGRLIADAEQRLDPGVCVGAVVGEGLAGPVAGDEDAPAADAEGGLLVNPALAVAGSQLAVCLFGLDGVEQPIGAAL
nr:hypothetical protein [Actinoplanes lichenis]